MPDQPLHDRPTNWGGNVVYSAARIHEPDSVEQVIDLIRAGRPVKALGSRHSFSTVADTTGDLVCTRRLNRVLDIDPQRMRATVEAGITYAALARQLHAQGYAVANLASLPHISVGGAVATATHGSGQSGCLATAVAAIELVTADGQVRRFARDEGSAAERDRFHGVVVSYGLLGIATSITLDIRPTFQIRQDVYDDVPLDAILDNFDAVMSHAYSVSLFTDFSGDRVNQVWVKSDVTNRAAEPALLKLLEGRRATVKRHPIRTAPADTCTEQGAAGPWHERLCHFRPDCEPSSTGQELQSEYFIARADAPAAIRAIASIGPRINDVLLISEIRTVAADRFWLSPCYNRDTVGLHFTWRPDLPAVRRRLAHIEATLTPFHPRPHFAKLFSLDAKQVQSAYPRLPDFLHLRHDLDPNGHFRNSFADEYLLNPPA